MEENTQKALDSAISQIEKDHGKGALMKLGSGSAYPDIESISTGSLTLDGALGIGGLPKGRVIEIYGPESSGKTTMALQVIAQAQKQGGTAAFIDAEHALDPKYAENLGVNIDELLLSQPDSGEQALEIAPDLTKVSAISSACSPESGCDRSSSSIFTPKFSAYFGSSACSASMKAAVPPCFCA